jgi:hypothetical protein
MAQTLTVAGAASLPFEDGTNVAPIQLAASLGFTSRADFVRAYSGAVADDPVDFGTLVAAGAKGVIVKCTAGSCTIKFQNNSSIAWPLAPGGYFIWINTAQAFPNAAFITTTGAASVVFVAVG